MKSFSQFLSEKQNYYKSTKEYREAEEISYSFLKDLYYSSYAFLKIPMKTSLFMDIGSAVDTLLTDAPDEQTTIIVINSLPTGQIAEVLDYLSDRYMGGFQQLEDLTEEQINEAYDAVGSKSRTSYDKKKESLIEHIEYYRAKMDSKNSIILTTELYNLVSDIVKLLKSCPKTKGIFNNTEKHVNNFFQFKSKGKLIDRDIKMMTDAITVNEDDKTITISDLKVGSTTTNNPFFQSFYGFKWYYQATIYYNIMLDIMTEYYMTFPEAEIYELQPFQFIYVNSNTPYYPIIYKINPEITIDLLTKSIVKEDSSKEIPSIKELFNAYDYYQSILDDNPGINLRVAIPYYLAKDDQIVKIDTLL